MSLIFLPLFFSMTQTDMGIADNKNKDLIGYEMIYYTKDIKDNIIFKKVTFFENGFSSVVYDDFCGKLDTKGNLVQKFDCENCWFYDDYTAIKMNEKWGAIDLANNMIIPPKYDNLHYLGDNLWEITVDNKKGIIDTLGNKIVPIIYDEFEYGNNDYIVAIKNDLYGVIDYKGKIILPFEYDGLSFSYTKREKCYIYAKKNNNMGIIDIKGDIIIPFNYKGLIYLSENTISAKLNKDKFILINEKNEQICKTIFKNIRKGVNMHPAKLGSLWGFIDEFGNIKIDFKYTDARERGLGYFAVAVKKNPKIDDYGLIDNKGKLILDYKYSDFILVIDDDRFIVEQDEEPFIVDRKGNVIVDKIYQWIIPIDNDGYMPVVLYNGYEGFIDRNGKPLKINKKTLKIPSTQINYNFGDLSQKEKISLLFDGKEMKKYN